MKGQLSEAECNHIISLTVLKPTGNAKLDNVAIQLINLLIVEPSFNIALSMIKYLSTKSTGVNWMHKCAEGGEVNVQLWLG